MFKFLGQFLYQWVDCYTAQFQVIGADVGGNGWRKKRCTLKRTNLKTAWRNAKRSVKLQEAYDQVYNVQPGQMTVVYNRVFGKYRGVR